MNKGDGTQITWFNIKSSEGELHPLGYNRFDIDEGARNNIALMYDGKDIYLYTMRAHFGYGVVTKYRAQIGNGGVLLDEIGRASMRSGICSCRFGSTVTIDDDGNEYLVKTARNVWAGRLRVVKDMIRWKSKGGK